MEVPVVIATFSKNWRSEVKILAMAYASSHDRRVTARGRSGSEREPRQVEANRKRPRMIEK